MMTCSPVMLRTRVVLRPMCSTTPVTSLDADRVADVERLVEHDRQRGEEVAEDVLDRERDRDAADAEAGDERRDVDAERPLQSAVMTTRVHSSTFAPTPIALIIATLARSLRRRAVLE